MRMSVREAKARFSEAISAAQRGEAVQVTRNGQPFVQITALSSRSAASFADLDRIRTEMGLDGYQIEFDWQYDSTALSREVLGLAP